MSTLLDSYLPYDSGPGANVSEAGWRSMAKHWRPDGIISNAGNGFNTFADSSGMQVKVDTGEVWLGGQWGQSTALKVLPIVANATGSNRLDQVVLRNDFVNNQIVLDVLTGTSSSTPPPVTQNTSIWEIPLGIVTVTNGAVTITAGQCVFNPQNNEYWVTCNSQSLVTNVAKTIGWDTVVTQSSDITLSTGGIVSIARGILTFNRAGLWMLSCQMDALLPNSNPNVTAFRLRTPADTGIIYLGSGSANCLSDSSPVRITTGQQLSFTVIQQTGSTININARFRAAFIRE